MREYSKNYLNPCSIPGCVRLVYAKSTCRTHYNRFARHGDYELHRPEPKPKRNCRVKGCERLAEWRGCCKKHGLRLYRHGNTNSIPHHWRKAEHAERKVANVFRAHGHKSEQLIRHGDGDLKVGDWLIEVKCADPQKGPREAIMWRFNIHRHGRMHEQCDYYILRFEKIPFFKSAVHIALKAPIGKKVLTYSFRQMVAGALGPGVELFKNLLAIKSKPLDKAEAK